MLEEFQNHLDKEEERRDTAEEQLHKASKNLVYVKAGVEHLADKLYHLKAVSVLYLFFFSKNKYEFIYCSEHVSCFNFNTIKHFITYEA
jgi:hypothetical protein